LSPRIDGAATDDGIAFWKVKLAVVAAFAAGSVIDPDVPPLIAVNCTGVVAVAEIGALVASLVGNGIGVGVGVAGQQKLPPPPPPPPPHAARIAAARTTKKTTRARIREKPPRSDLARP
jgi:hypothetical protein